MIRLRTALVVCAVLGMRCPAATAQDRLTPHSASAALRSAVEFFRSQVAVEGGYVWRYSADLSRREGEGAASATTAWIQPPGTPAIGLAYLRAFEATGDRYYLDSARETAQALVRGQLRSGGWSEAIQFDPQRRAEHAYRVDPDNPLSKNVSTLDDDKTQSCIRFLARLDRAFEFHDHQLHEAAGFALAALLRAQYPNGAWPQKFTEPHDRDDLPVRKATYPASWPRTFSKRNYSGDYTLNDATLSDAVEALLEAAEMYGESRYKEAAVRGGDFLLLAQMPDPQPAWAQQYDRDMHPTWARKFEPPAVTGGESQAAIRTLLRIYETTRDKKYLEPIPRAIDYLRRSQLPDGRLARFYELESNRPLYFTRDYQLTYRDDDLPTHYSFKSASRLDALEKEYRNVLARGESPRIVSGERPGVELTDRLKSDAARVIAALDPQGRWTEPGRLRSDPTSVEGQRIIDCLTFIRNVNILCDYLAATK